MDFLRVPPALRRTILCHPNISAALRRHVSTATESYGPNTAPPISHSTSSLLTLSSATLNSYATSTPPTTPDLKHASTFFTRHPPTILFSAANFRNFPPSPFPEVAFLGRSNVGKSSLLNALFGRPIQKPAHVSKRPGRTKTMNGFGIGSPSELKSTSKPAKVPGKKPTPVDPRWKRFVQGGLIVVDMPGYGAASREEWGVEIMKYLYNRKQLRRTYVLIDAVHGLKPSDVMLLTDLRQRGIAHQVVLSKVDKLLRPAAASPGPQKVHHGLLSLQRTCQGIRVKLNEAAGQAGGRDDVMEDILCCSAEKSIDEATRNRRIGVDEVRWSVLTACGLDGGSSLEIRKAYTNSTARTADGDGDAVMPYEAFS